MGTTDGNEPGFDLGSDNTPGRDGGYRVLARKYRPTTFEHLIGQEAMVRTLSNAFDTGRIAQAYLFTGVRGVGKTTTARILARALNYDLPGEVDKPSIHMPRLGRHCQAIMEGRHIDVMEIDAASHTGIDDVRQITDGVHYAPVSARYKVYILDEVHMLSEKAWNAFLKTLEEPPPHVKFMFATTEVGEVPITVLSRCQRFDLRRVDADTLVGHLGGVAAREGITIAPDALALIARASEGSVRDSLSILDQAIAHGAGSVETEAVRQMLGLADRTRIIDLFEHLMGGRIAEAMSEMRAQYDSGAEPLAILLALAELVHLITRIRINADAASDHSLSESERLRGTELAGRLSMRLLSRAWQMLVKGIDEVKNSPRPLASADMVLVRIAYAADLPTPDEALKMLAEGGGAARLPAPSPSPAPRGPGGGGGPSGHLAIAASTGVPMPRREVDAAPEVTIASLADLSRLAAERRDLVLKRDIEQHVRLVALEPGRLTIRIVGAAPAMLGNDLTRKLSEWTGRRWLVALSSEEGEPTLREQKAAAAEEAERGVRAHPLIQAVLATFPGADILSVKPLGGDTETPEAETQPDILPAWQDDDEDDL